MSDEGAVLYCEGSPKTIAEALEIIVSELGYTRRADAHLEQRTIAEVLHDTIHGVDTRPTHLDLDVRTAADAIAFVGEVRKTFAMALARRLARRVGGPVRVLTARLIERDDSETDFTCDVDDVSVMPDGATKPGRWARDTVDAYGSSWGDVCDGKAYFAVTSLLEDACETVLPESTGEATMHFRGPASLGSPRLDELAEQVRLADRSVLGEMGGRTCLRITTQGTTRTSFLDPSAVDALRAALGALLAEK